MKTKEQCITFALIVIMCVIVINPIFMENNNEASGIREKIEKQFRQQWRDSGSPVIYATTEELLEFFQSEISLLQSQLLERVERDITGSEFSSNKIGKIQQEAFMIAKDRDILIINEVFKDL